MKKWFIALLLLLLVGGGAYLTWRPFSSKAPADGEGDLQTARIARGNIQLTIESTGSVESNLDVDIKSKASGEIISLPYDVSQRVVAYQQGRNEHQALLVALDPIDEKRHVEQCQASVAAAQAKLGQAQSALEVACENVRTGDLEAKAVLASAKGQGQYGRPDAPTTERAFPA